MRDALPQFWINSRWTGKRCRSVGEKILSTNVVGYEERTSGRIVANSEASQQWRSGKRKTNSWRVVGNPYLIALRQICQSLGNNPTARWRRQTRLSGLQS